MSSPAEVDSQLAVIIGEFADECKRIRIVLGQSLHNLEPLGRSIHDADAVRVGREDVTEKTMRFG